MILHRDEARESWKRTAQDLKAKVVEIPGTALSNYDASCLINILAMFCEYVDKEAKEAHNKRI